VKLFSRYSIGGFAVLVDDIIMPVVTRLERQQRHKDRVNVYLDGEFALGLNELDAARLRKGQTLSEEELLHLRELDAVVKAVDVGVHLLAYRPRSIQEVRQHLTTKGTPPPVIDAAVTRLTDMGYLDDRAFAQRWLDSRQRTKPSGAKALRYELRLKGIASDIIDELLTESLDATVTEQAARQAAHSQLRKLRGLSRSAFRTKLGAFLQRRGFQYATASQVIRQVMEEQSEQDPAYFVSAGSAEDE
jgi:regulatory protein